MSNAKGPQYGGQFAYRLEVHGSGFALPRLDISDRLSVGGVVVAGFIAEIAVFHFVSLVELLSYSLHHFAMERNFY